MKMKTQEYVLAYGFRRYSACEKLGWKTIPCFIQEENCVKDLNIDDITVLNNTRLEGGTEGFTELMQSIKQHGLLEPIGVWKAENLKEKDFILLNLTENIHRENISPVALAKACNQLKKLGMNSEEISVRLSLSKSKVRQIIDLSQRIGEENLKKVSFNDESRSSSRNGKIPVTTMNAISNATRNKADFNSLVKVTKEKALTSSQIALIRNLVRAGMTIKQATKALDKYDIASVTVVFNKVELERLQKLYRCSMNEVVNKALLGRIKLDDNAIYWKK